MKLTFALVILVGVLIYGLGRMFDAVKASADARNAAIVSVINAR